MKMVTPYFNRPNFLCISLEGLYARKLLAVYGDESSFCGLLINSYIVSFCMPPMHITKITSLNKQQRWLLYFLT